MTLPATYLPKFVASVISTLACAHHLFDLLHRKPKSWPVLRAWLAVFFAGGGVSSGIGAVLEVLDDAGDDVASSVMLIGVEVAALGAWSAGVALGVRGRSLHRAGPPRSLPRPGRRDQSLTPRRR